ncbi:MAG: M3 family peptidase, partial [Actinobacteria bacterium]|nr:M3 family peptidase [Actinomycetota bacterium]
MTAPTLDPTNPFARPSVLPYGLPDFTQIRFEHYRPALLAGMAEERAQIEAIATDSQPPTFENTVVALERTGDLLERVTAVVYNQLSADASAELEQLEEEIAPLLSAHADAIHLDSRLFARVDAVHTAAARGEIVLDDQDAWLLERVHTDFVLAGVHLDEVGKERLRELNSRITTLDAAFGRTLLAATNAGAVVLTDESELDGLSPQEIAAAALAAQEHQVEGWWIELANTTGQPL